MKKVISINYGSSTSSWKPWRWVRLDLIFSMRGIYINSNLNPLAAFASSSRSTKAKDILPWNISQMIRKTVQIRTRIVLSYAMKRASRCEFDGKSKTTATWSEFPNVGKAIVEQMLASRKKEIQKIRTVTITVRDLSRKVNHLSNGIWDGKILSEFTRSIISTKIGKPVLMTDVKVSKEKHISGWIDWKSLIYEDEAESKTVHKDEEGDWKRKKK